MTHSFGLEIIAEGIENDRQCDRLYRMGCQEGQGYLFSQPLPALVFGDMFGIGGGALAMRA
jgi:EAL domain-containing protein (putative c-di-GMP-specific phosphodiesterase class I)